MAILLVVALVAVAIGQATSGGSSDRPFAKSWAAALPAHTTPLASSATIVDNLVSQYRNNYGSVAVNDSSYGIGIYEVSRSQAPVTIHVRAGCNNFTPDTGTAIPIPPNTVPPSGNDSSVAIWQPSTGSDWELWQLQHTNGIWSACWGGLLHDLAATTGIFPSPFGVAASGISYLGTTVTEADVASGHIDHVLAIGVIACNRFVAPADRGDCASDPGTPPEGTWFRLPANLPTPAGLTPFALMVFHALKTYGAVVSDRSGAVALSAENYADWTNQGHHGTDPITASFAGQPEYKALNGIPWPSLQAINPPR